MLHRLPLAFIIALAVSIPCKYIHSTRKHKTRNNTCCFGDFHSAGFVFACTRFVFACTKFMCMTSFDNMQNLACTNQVRVNENQMCRIQHLELARDTRPHSTARMKTESHGRTEAQTTNWLASHAAGGSSWDLPKVGSVLISHCSPLPASKMVGSHDNRPMPARKFAKQA